MKKTVLIVEDDSDIQGYYRIILSRLGLELLRAADGREALGIIESGAAIDLILLDVVMPVMDGTEFFRRLRIDKGLKIPVILSSVDEAMADRVRAIGPVEGVFLKGRAGGELVAMIREMLQLPAA
jgi:CheY-like chemotaxis protein